MKQRGKPSVLLVSAVALYLGVAYFSLAFADEFRYDSHDQRDPFTAPGEEIAAGGQVGHSQLRLEGVVVDEKGTSYVIVNSEIVRQGDTFQGFLLKKVEPNQATFEKEGEHFEVLLRQDNDGS